MTIVLGILAMLAGLCAGGALLGLVTVILAARNDRATEFPRATVITRGSRR